MHFLIGLLLFALLIAALVGNRIAILALATLTMILASLILLVIGLPFGSANSEVLWLIPPGFWGLIALGRWARNG